MKKALKLVGSFIIGAVGGFLLATIGVLLFTDIDLAHFLHSLKDTTLSLKGIGVGVFSLSAVIVSLVIHIFIHELGHLICGIATGYRFVSFRIFNIAFIKKEGKLCTKRFSIAGTGGQCLLAPPDRPTEEIPTAIYNLGGVLANIVASLVALPLLFIIENPLICTGITLFIIIGAAIALLNGIPMRIGGIGNDGYNMLLLHKNRYNKELLMLQLKANALAQEGVRPKDMPTEWFQSDREMDYGNTFQIYTILLKAARMLDKYEWESAHILLAEAYEHKKEIMQLYANEIACELLFTSLITGREESVQELYTPELATYINTYRKVMSSKERLLCAIALYKEKETEKAHKIYQNLLKSKDNYLMLGEVASDIAIMEKILNHHI